MQTMSPFGKRDGYTLMELLVVIGIIGVLAGLIFPVAAGAKKRARQAQCINNLYQIFTALKQFQLDEHRYPEFLAGPVQWRESDGTYKYASTGTIVPLTENTGMVAGTNGGNGRAVSLYPEYIEALTTLKCPFTDLNGDYAEMLDSAGNKAPRSYSVGALGVVQDDSSIIADPMYEILRARCPPERMPSRGKGLEGLGTAYGTGAFTLYKYSSYDYQKPYNTTIDEVHYSPAWMDYDPTLPLLPDQRNADRQLRWRTPPATTVVTWCSHHRSVDGTGAPSFGSKDVVLFLDGHVKTAASNNMEPWSTVGWAVVPGD
jgi:prepilin-type N-terminal cleavage/methylation domain-containing protein